MIYVELLVFGLLILALTFAVAAGACSVVGAILGLAVGIYHRRPGSLLDTINRGAAWGAWVGLAVGLVLVALWWGGFLS